MIVLIKDDIVAGNRQEIGFAAQDFATNRVKSAQPNAISICAQNFGHTVAHLAGGFVGEGDGEDVPGGDVHDAYQVGDAIGQHTGFSRAGACQNDGGSCRGGYGVLLLFVENL